ncbi:hypothetical protein [Actinoplanes sp. URMC 104]|uniref:hypothetical protein n=1 Tax=Actinoplanes sp. URMC 104 TaxID=3423409 RepID=UPI003F1D9109
MLSDRDRTLLAPHLALLRRAQKELAEAQRDADEAERKLAASAGSTDWRDRMFGGLFSADDRRTQGFKQARAAQQAAGKALEAARRKHAKYAERMDGLFEPMLTERDSGFRARVDAVRACDRALRQCERMRSRISSVSRDARKQGRGKGEQGGGSWHEAEFARRRFDETMAEIRASGPALRKAIELAAQAVGEPARGTAAIDTSALPAWGPAAQQQVAALNREVELAAKEVARWRKSAERARVQALRAAQDAL